MGTETRQKSAPISVRLSETERQRVHQLANACSLAPSTYLRQLGLGHEPKSTVDQQVIHRLALLNGDLNRVGGLLKMWLSNEERAGFGKSLDVAGALDELRDLSEQIEQTISAL